MDVRDRLLHNEIQNLGQMVQIVSYELTLLSDFMKEKFGPSYEAFRQRHSQDTGASQSSSDKILGSEPSNSKKGSITARKSTCSQSQIKRSHVDGGSPALETKRMKTDANNDGDGIDKTGENLDGYAEDFDLNDDSLLNETSGDEDYTNLSISSVTGANDIPEGAELMMFPQKKDPDERNIGRARSDIWNKYIVSKLSDGKLHAVCPHCKLAVSCKVERLTNHYRKCALGERKLKSNSEGKKSQAETCIEEEDKKKVTEYIKILRDSRTSGQNKPTSSSSGGASRHEGHEVNYDYARHGRKADPVWEYFQVTEDPETKKRIVKCKRCNVTVSSKVERARRHFIMCLELDKEGDVKGS